jgi:hypothetical protein
MRALTDYLRCSQAGHSYFRIHPKGNGIVVQQPGGLPPITFVSEYLGEMHTPARWFEIQVRPQRQLQHSGQPAQTMYSQQVCLQWHEIQSFSQIRDMRMVMQHLAMT